MLQFLLGLAIGLAIMAWYRRRLRLQIAEALGNVDLRASLGSPRTFRTSSQVPMAAVFQLATVVGHQQERCQQLEQQVEAWKQVLYRAPIAYLQLDDENRLVWCNAAAHKLLAIPQWELVTPRLLLQLVRSYELDQLIDETRAHQQPVCTDWVFHLPLSPESVPSAQSRREGISIRGYGLPLANGQVGVFLEN
ncbi:MAG: histidine kinase, partial [Cyanobacteria bacterium]|nr:histidine kinase [Cyanobacteriota bacterium]MDW8202628.1 histidine kinase [Cyanobacteriota bacterium SKYGB_h_bin112]